VAIGLVKGWYVRRVRTVRKGSVWKAVGEAEEAAARRAVEERVEQEGKERREAHRGQVALASQTLEPVAKRRRNTREIGG